MNTLLPAAIQPLPINSSKPGNLTQRRGERRGGFDAASPKAGRRVRGCGDSFIPLVAYFWQNGDGLRIGTTLPKSVGFGGNGTEPESAKVTLFRPEKAESSTTKTATKTALKTELKTGLKHSLSPKARTIAELMEKNPLIGIAGIAEATGLSRGGVNYLVRMLKEKAGLVRVGGRKAGHWEFKEVP